MRNWDFKDFFTLSTFKNGNLKVEISIENRENIYKLLKQKGFGFFKYGKEFRFYRNFEGQKKYISFTEINYFFLNEYLENELIFETQTFSIRDYNDLFNYIISREISLVKNDNLFKYYLYNIPTEKEMHTINMQLDFNYRIKYENRKYLDFFKSNSFEEKIDLKSNISTGKIIYYKKISKNLFLIFNQFANEFDCWIVKFKKESDIGKYLPLSKKEIKINFNLETDMRIINSYLN